MSRHSKPLGQSAFLLVLAIALCTCGTKQQPRATSTNAAPSENTDNPVVQCEAILKVGQDAPDFERHVLGMKYAAYWELRDKLLSKCIAEPQQYRDCLRRKKTIADGLRCQKLTFAGSSPVQERPRTDEARRNLKKIYDGARQYYMAVHKDATGKPLAHQLPGPSQGSTPALGSCCVTDNNKCAPDQSLWTNPTWTALQFSADDPHYYSYSYTLSASGKSFTVHANGDLDCDAKYSTFEMMGVVRNNAIASGAGLYRENELE